MILCHHNYDYGIDWMPELLYEMFTCMCCLATDVVSGAFSSVELRNMYSQQV